MEDINITVFTNKLYGKVQREYPLLTALGWIKNPESAGGSRVARYVENYRRLRAELKEGQAQAKNKIPAIFPHLYKPVVPMKNEKEPRQSNCLMQNFIRNDGISILDLDGLSNEEMVEVAMDLQTLPYVGFYFVSPSGNGLKVGVLHQATESDRHYKALYETLYSECLPKWLRDRCDESVKNDTWKRCYFSTDKHCYINDDPEPLEIVFPEPKPYIITSSPVSSDNSTAHKVLELLAMEYKVIQIKHYNDFFKVAMIFSYHERPDLFIKIIEDLDVYQMDTKNPDKYKMPLAMEKYNALLEENRVKKQRVLMGEIVRMVDYRHLGSLLYPDRNINKGFEEVEFNMEPPIPPENWR